MVSGFMVSVSWYNFLGSRNMMCLIFKCSKCLAHAWHGRNWEKILTIFNCILWGSRYSSLVEHFSSTPKALCSIPSTHNKSKSKLHFNLLSSSVAEAHVFCLQVLRVKYPATTVPGGRVSFLEATSSHHLIAVGSPSPWSCRSGDSGYRSHCPCLGPYDGGCQWCRSPAPGSHPFHFPGHHLLPWEPKSNFGRQSVRRKLVSRSRVCRKFTDT